ncbi:S-adenosyl-L-methionine-dependent methyltransferase [Crucibulum laeve]|uniref:S-adenosyl-L-methionine-dependent methyltransferase n=1 Tax=Crucibulum laeve TaxID=68775 RepID=A0A5C3MJD0_9AGAR|nr:S-adenosyl-L-methionine-dependent methyltransferase [Crucibulum laeve]
MLPTPDLSHLSTDDFEVVYEPAEDTFLFLDALEADAETLKDLKPSICLEIGSGSGCLSAFLGNILGPSVLYLCTDINPHACKCTEMTGTQNKVFLEAINVSLAFPLHDRLKHNVDIILFNPPYVPTLSNEAVGAQSLGTIGGAWAGGMDGMEVTNTFLQYVEQLLSARGRFYLVALKQNNIPIIRQSMLNSHGLRSEIVLQRRAGIEHLFIIRFHREKQD